MSPIIQPKSSPTPVPTSQVSSRVPSPVQHPTDPMAPSPTFPALISHASTTLPSPAHPHPSSRVPSPIQHTTVPTAPSPTFPALISSSHASTTLPSLGHPHPSSQVPSPVQHSTVPMAPSLTIPPPNPQPSSFIQQTALSSPAPNPPPNSQASLIQQETQASQTTQASQGSIMNFQASSALFPTVPHVPSQSIALNPHASSLITSATQVSGFAPNPNQASFIFPQTTPNSVINPNTLMSEELYSWPTEFNQQGLGNQDLFDFSGLQDFSGTNDFNRNGFGPVMNVRLVFQILFTLNHVVDCCTRERQQSQRSSRYDVPRSRSCCGSSQP